MKNKFSPKLAFPVFAVLVLSLGLFTAIYSAQQNQDRRSLASAPASLWDNTVVPANPSWNDAKAVTLGVKFKPLADGTITGIKFYKGTENIGTHSASLWTSTGQLLAQATFTNETASGWQQVSFSTPVAVTANTTYVASYFAPAGHYSVNRPYFTSQYTNGLLSALANGAEGGNGVYKYGSTHAFPTSTYQSSNYWVDVIFEASSLAPTSTPTPATPPVASCPTGAVICEENKKPGNPASEWDVAGAGSANIQGFATDMSVNKGQTIQFKVNTDSNNYRFDIYRIGYYGGMGARKVATIEPSAALPQTQPACSTDTTVSLVDCGNWSVSGSWNVPSDAVSGVYIAKLIREDTTAGSSHIIFVVRDDESHSDILVQTSDSTWQAYNKYGGSSLYAGTNATDTNGKASKVSYNRPLTARGWSCCAGGKNSTFFTAEYPMIRWLEANGYNASYTSSIDTATRGSEILEHKLFISSGHDEYWSNEMRSNVEAARGAGINLAFFSANEVFWKARWENSIDGSNTPYRTMVVYKETAANAKIDPSPLWTGTWRDPRFSPPSDGGRPENALTGQLFMVNGLRNDAMTVPAEYGNMRLWRNTSIATLPTGQTATFPAGTLGYEWDEIVDNEFEPAGIVKMSKTTISILDGKYVINSSYGSKFGNGIATHNLSLYRQPGGGLVFGAGVTQWAWGLDANHDYAGSPTDIRMQQATVNLFADMGIQPVSLQPGLVPATASTDTTPPVANITSPADGSSVEADSEITIQGTASDIGGVVAGVEVSVDGGTTWHPATGRTNWQYTWIPIKTGTAMIKVRAVDDSANLETYAASSNIAITVNVVPNPNPVGYRWANNTSSTADTNRVFLPGLLNNDTTDSLPLNNGLDDFANAWEAAGVILPTSQNITSVEYTNGAWTTSNNGAFSANVTLQFTTDGTTWFDSGWTISPAYDYDSSASAGKKYTFSGTAASIKGARVVGQVHTAGSKSYYANASELKILAVPTSTPTPTSALASLWDNTVVPANPSWNDSKPVTLGVKFKPSIDGLITGIKFYKGAENIGAHSASLWTSTGQLLAQATFTNETASGWQQVSFSTPVAVTANTTYVASYFAPAGHYSVNRPYFTSQYTNGLLSALANGAEGGNGVYKYASTHAFPNSTYQSGNYWVDVLFNAN